VLTFVTTIIAAANTSNPACTGQLPNITREKLTLPCKKYPAEKKFSRTKPQDITQNIP